MDGRCILCDTAIEAVGTTAPAPEGPDVVCVRCRALPAEERRMLREQAMVRMLWAEMKSQRRE
jgi:hypothetical protein